jgi:predicted nucleotidyltransferase
VNSVKAECVVLFGSYAKGTETEKSDVDLLCVSNEKNIENVANIFKTKYALTIRPVVIRQSDFKNIKRDNETFYRDMVEFGIVLSGLEFFFKEVYR